MNSAELTLPEAIESRRRELQRKREQLAELKRQKESRDEKQQGFGGLVGSYGSELDSLGFLNSSKKELDTFITSLLKSNETKGQSTQVDLSPARDEEDRQRTEKSRQDLVMSDFVLTEVVPKVSVKYSKEVQTVETEFVPITTEGTKSIAKNEEIPSGTEDTLNAEIISKESIKSQDMDPIAKQTDADAIRRMLDELSDEKRQSILESEEFVEFFEKSSKFMERALNEDYDVLIDYTTIEADTSNAETKSEVKLIRTFSHERFTKDRSITDIDWCKSFPELVLASYTKDLVNYDAPSGQVLVWNMHMSERPEFSLFADSEIMSCRFSPFHSNIIVGGSYSGQVLIWDTRASKYPTLNTSVASVGHMHPIYSMGFLGTTNAHHVLTASTDGVVCTWQVDMLSHPVEMLELTSNRHTRIDEVGVTCIGIPRNETVSFWVGTEEGVVYQASRFDRPGSKSGIDTRIAYAGHAGMVTGIDFHPGGSRHRYNQYFLTSSIDWSIKLWKAENTDISSGANLPSSKQATVDKSCLFSFEDADDYVFDVKWSPTNSAVFAACLGNGKLMLYNLSQSESPVVVEDVPGDCGLLKLGFDRDGKKLAVGARDGRLHVYDTNPLIQMGDESSLQLFLKEYSAHSS